MKETNNVPNYNFYKERLTNWLFLGWTQLWLLILVVLLFKVDSLAKLLEIDKFSILYGGGELFLHTLLLGGIGGAIAAIPALLNSLYQGQFDNRYTFYFIIKPLMGMIAGSLIYFIVLMVSRLFNIPLQDSKVELLTYFFAIIAGVNEKGVFNLISKINHYIFPDIALKVKQPADAKNIIYKAYSRPSFSGTGQVLNLFASCSFENGERHIFFVEDGQDKYKLMQELLVSSNFLNTYCVASFTAKEESPNLPNFIVITDAHGEHKIPVEPIS